METFRMVHMTGMRSQQEEGRVEVASRGKAKRSGGMYAECRVLHTLRSSSAGVRTATRSTIPVRNFDGGAAVRIGKGRALPMHGLRSYDMSLGKISPYRYLETPLAGTNP